MFPPEIFLNLDNISRKTEPNQVMWVYHEISLRMLCNLIVNEAPLSSLLKLNCTLIVHIPLQIPSLINTVSVNIHVYKLFDGL